MCPPVEMTVQVDKGSMTDFDQLHAPIALTNAAEPPTEITSLLGELEMAANATEQQEDGLEINPSARAAFQAKTQTKDQASVPNASTTTTEEQELDALLQL